MTTLAIEFASNVFGKCKPYMVERLNAVVDNPCQATWQDAHAIVLDWTGRPKTLWIAVCDIDPKFTRSKPLNALWPEIPSQETIIKAIGKVTLGKFCNPQ